MLHERLQHRELGARELDRGVVSPHGAVGGVEHESTALEARRSRVIAAPSQGPQPRLQFREGEGLGQVVVGAAIEPADAIGDRIARGEHQDRRPDVVLAKALAGLEAVDPGQHDVEDDRVVGCRSRHPERVLAGLGEVDCVAVLLQALAQQPAQLQLVLDDQDPHARPIRWRSVVVGEVLDTLEILIERDVDFTRAVSTSTS